MRILVVDMNNHLVFTATVVFGYLSKRLHLNALDCALRCRWVQLGCRVGCSVGVRCAGAAEFARDHKYGEKKDLHSTPSRWSAESSEIRSS